MIRRFLALLTLISFVATGDHGPDIPHKELKLFCPLGQTCRLPEDELVTA